MPQIRPITDLRNTTEISELCHAKNEPLFITKNGYGDLVVMSIEAYEEMLKTSQMDAVINEAEKSLLQGRNCWMRGIHFRLCIESILDKYFGLIYGKTLFPCLSGFR